MANLLRQPHSTEQATNKSESCGATRRTTGRYGASRPVRPPADADLLLGADLPAGVIAAFEGWVAECGHVTSGDVVPLGTYRLQPAEASEEFYKLALDLKLGQSYASAIRDAVRRAR